MIIDRDNVIKGLQELSDEAYSRWVHCQHTTDKLIIGIGKYVDKAVELLKTQEPKSVKNIDDTEVGIRSGFCPECQELIYYNILHLAKFCKYCGQAVKWNDY